LTLRILLVDDFPAVRKGLKHLVEMNEAWEVVAEAGDGQEGLQEAQRLQPDVAVVDIGMPIMNGLELTRALQKSAPNTKVLILTEQNSQRMMQEARNAGADGYVIKSHAGSELLPALEALSEERPFFSSLGIDD
jgi:DNA-binding NarL/FixJ family response regulator